MKTFGDQDMISTFVDLNKNHAPQEFIFRKNQDCFVYYDLWFDEDTPQFPKIRMSIKTDTGPVTVQLLHVPSPSMVCSRTEY